MIGDGLMSRFWQHLIWSSLGVSGILFVVNKGTQLYFTDVFIIIAGIGFGSLFMYGVVNIIKDIRVGKTFKGTLREVIKNIKGALYG